MESYKIKGLIKAAYVLGSRDGDGCATIYDRQLLHLGTGGAVRYLAGGIGNHLGGAALGQLVEVLLLRAGSLANNDAILAD